MRIALLLLLAVVLAFGPMACGDKKSASPPGPLVQDASEYRSDSDDDKAVAKAPRASTKSKTTSGKFTERPDVEYKAGLDEFAKKEVERVLREPPPAKDSPVEKGGKDAKSGPLTPAPVPSASPPPPPVPTTPPPAVAEAVIGTAKNPSKVRKEEGPQSGILTAGSFDDNLDPPVFHTFVRQRAQSQGLGDLPRKLVGHRLQILVRDGMGRPVGNALVKLSAANGANAEIATRSDGRAVFMLSFDQLPADQPLTASVTPPNGGSPITDTITPGAARWDFSLPGVQAQLPKNLDLAIVLDTTGSMGDEIAHLKAEIRGISAAIQKRFPEVQQRFALVLYRDEGDEYVTRSFDFNPSLDKFHESIAAQSAAGGGDYPEAMHKGLEEANQLRWKQRDTSSVLFLIADAPPHAQHMNKTLAAVNNLRKRGVSIYPIACSGYDNDCEFVMRSCALLTGSQFLFLTDDSGVGGGHAEPKIPYYSVERLERLMIRMIAGELAGQRVDPAPSEIIRSVGAKRVN
jgi:hypothetical protein